MMPKKKRITKIKAKKGESRGSLVLVLAEEVDESRTG
jgi:hypothetical protein